MSIATVARHDSATGPQRLRGRLPRGPRSRWLSLFVVTRAGATSVAILLLVIHRVTDRDQALALAGLLYGLGSIVAVLAWPRLERARLAWLADTAATFGLIVASEGWRSPFYLLCVTALILPATTLRLRSALLAGLTFAVAFFVVSVLVGVDFAELDATSRLESFVTYLTVPLALVLALAYAVDLLERLQGERERSERLALEAERRRIAWELHDSAKQRVHAAHLLLSALGGDGAGAGDLVEQAMSELRAATADMETSLSELRAPLVEGRRLDAVLRERAAELRPAAGGARIEVAGEAPRLPAFMAAHAYRIAGEALTNAVRHAEASTIRVGLDGRDGSLRITVVDDGRGMPDQPRPGANGLRSMRSRAQTIGGELRIAPGAGGRGTEVRLQAPLAGQPEARA